MLELGKNDVLTIVNCGHPSPLMLSHDGPVALDPPEAAPPIGLGSRGVVATVRLAPHERLLLYTDGLLEARDPSGRFIRCEELLDGVADERFDDVADVVVHRLRLRTGGRIRDDLALVLVEAFPGSPAPRTLPSAPPAKATS